MRSAEAPVRITEAASCSLVRLAALPDLYCHLNHPYQTRAIARPSTAAAPARLSSAEAAAIVAPVVMTSSMSSKRQPRTSSTVSYMPRACSRRSSRPSSRWSPCPYLTRASSSGHTRQLAKRARDGFHMIESTPPKRCRRRRHKHHRIRTGQHTCHSDRALRPGHAGRCRRAAPPDTVPDVARPRPCTL